ncbi:MAG: hypothetical protein RLZZ324_131 [Candidatus Parcubacteria bacterium]|jgi:thiamine biosynthesis lipoprotein
MSAESPSARIAFEAIGTHWQIDIDEPLTPERRSGLFDAVRTRIATFDKDYSRFRTDSLVSEMARRTGTYRLPGDAQPMFDLYRRVYDVTGGAFTPLIGQALSDAGYDASYSLTPGVMREPPRWDDALRYAYPDLEVKLPVLLDFGAAGKGYLIDIVGGVLEEHGVTSYAIDAGQDILFRSSRGGALRVGLENPTDVSEVLGVVTLTGGSICGSAGNRRAWATFNHILDPRTLTSPAHIAACWTRASSAMLADAMSTALYFVPPSALEPHFAFEWCILRPDFTVESSPGFGAELFTA